MQLRAGVMLPSAKGELSRKQKFPTLHVVAMEKLTRNFLNTYSAIRNNSYKEEKKKQALKETPAKKSVRSAVTPER